MKRTMSKVAGSLVLGLGVGLVWTLMARADDPAPAPAEQAKAAIGSQAPAFNLRDLDGKEHTLASLQGRPVVLEWFDPESPYVAKHHVKGNVQTLLERHHEQEVQWLAIASGKSADAERCRLASEGWMVRVPVLLDPTGTVARCYGVSVAPHMFVIDKDGVLRYEGAMDADASKETVGTVNYVDKALTALAEGQEVATPSTFPYGTKIVLPGLD